MSSSFSIFANSQALNAVLLASSRPTYDSAWHGHVAFAHWVVEAIRPQVIVELGTQHGVSFAAFCRPVKVLGLDTKCYAVDTWEGDIQTGSYSDETFNDLQRYSRNEFGDKSVLLRCLFDDALDRFEDGSIDLLHIDGLHTYQAVKHDFDTWLPKMSSRGVVLFHDVNVRTEGFGVWKLWDELAPKYPSFLFLHSAGLGVLAVGSQAHERVLSLCAERSPSEIYVLRNEFSILSNRAYEIGLSNVNIVVPE